MLFWLLPVLLCYVAFSACKRSAESQTECCPRTPRWRFSFSIVFFREPSDLTTIQMDQLVQMDTHTHSASLIFLSCSSADFSAWTQPETAGHGEWVCVCSSAELRLGLVPQTPRSNQETTPASQLTLSAPAASPTTSGQHGTQTPCSILICLSLLVSFSGC